MAGTEQEKQHQALLEALYKARRHVAALEEALARSAAFLGTGIEAPPSLPDNPENAADELFKYLELVELEDDISNYLGREGDDASRPRLGSDAPEVVRPDKAPQVSPLIGQLALGHPDDAIVFDAPAAVAEGGHRQDAGQSGVEAFRTGTLPGGVADADGKTFVPAVSDETGLRAYLALQAVNAGVWHWDLQSSEVFVSERWQQIIGINAPAGNDAWSSLTAGLHPTDARVLVGRVRDFLAGKGLRTRMAVRFRANAQQGWGWAVVSALCRRSRGKPQRIVATLIDISQHREAEIALRAGSDKYRFLLGEEPYVICRFDTKGRILSVSPNIIRYSTVSAPDLIGHMPGEFSLYGDTGVISEGVREVVASRRPVQVEAVLQAPLSGEFLANCRFWPEFSVEGILVGVTVLTHDITYSRRVAEKFYTVFDRMDDGFILFEHVPEWSIADEYAPEEFSVLFANPAFARMLSLRSPMPVGVRLADLLPEDAAEWGRWLKQVLREKRNILLPFRSRRFPGSFELRAYSPGPGRVACILKDVTELQRIEQETRLNEARLAAVYRLSQMDAAPEERMVRFSLDQAVKLTGSSLGYLYISGGPDSDTGFIYRSSPLRESGKTTTGGAAADVLQMPHTTGLALAKNGFMDVFGEDIPLDRYLLAPVTEEGKIVCIAGVANKQQDYSPADLRQLELFINGMWFHLRRRWAVQSLHRAKEEAEAASRAKNEFLANVSHELRTPLNGILGMLQVLQRSPLDAEQQECAGTASHSGRILLRIISDILDFSRIEAGRFALSPHLFDFPAAVRSTLGMFQHLAEEKNVELALQMDETIPATLMGDDARVRQVIFNLVGNALKFTEKGRVTVGCARLPRCPEGKCCLYLSVVDTGIGIPPERLRDIFTAFTQIDGSSTKRHGGTGLGLPIVQRLVDMMGGGISIDSSPEEGTSVHCSLQFDVPKNLQEAAAPDVPAAGEPVPLDILVVEDDPVNRFTLRTLLNKSGYTSVTTADDGRQALEILALKAFDCIITDIQMPVMDGVELTRRIREGNMDDIVPLPELVERFADTGKTGPARHRVAPDIPIIALTAYAMAGDRERFLGMGMDYYLPKPINSADLAAMLAHIGMLLRAREESGE